MLSRRSLLGYFSAVPFLGFAVKPNVLPVLKFEHDQISNAEELLGDIEWKKELLEEEGWLCWHRRDRLVWLPENNVGGNLLLRDHSFGQLGEQTVGISGEVLLKQYKYITSNGREHIGKYSINLTPNTQLNYK